MVSRYNRPDELEEQARVAAAGLAQGEQALASVLRELAGGEADGRTQDEVRALLTLAAAVAAVHKLDDVIETAAEEACRALGAGSLSISRIELDGFQLRTLINVGELGPGEERFPENEVYELRDWPRALDMFEQLKPYMSDVDNPNGDAAERELLRSLGKSSGIAVPITFADRVWGELYATRAAGEPPFTDGDLRFLQAIAGQLAAAIGRAEMFTHMAELAYEDSLTGLANRRALDERLEDELTAALRDDRDLALVLCDVDNLKEINDGLGHHAGDAALLGIANALRDAAAESEDSLVARLGGDEFCVLLPGASAAAARAVVERALEALVADDPAAAGLSAGIASIGTGGRRPADLMHAADAALYTAKRNGRRRVFVARSEDAYAHSSARERREQPLPPALAGALHRMLGETVNELDGLAAPALERLSVAIARIAAVAGVRAWAISHADRDGGVVSTVDWRDTRFHDVEWADTADEHYVIDDYPATAAIIAAGGSFVLRADDADAHPGELALLAEGGFSSVVAAAARWEHGAWLVEVYGDDASVDPAVIEPYVRLLVADAVRGAVAHMSPGYARDVSAVDG